ncbi:MAG: DNA repair protein RecO [Planctomycetes bacterium]|nr:DNA repair protein RecO [Planctomycetota bacterium]
MIRSDRVLILRRFAYGETSLVLHVLTPNFGRVHLLAKGAYRPTSRYYAVLDLFDTLELEWSHAAGRELDTLRAGDLAQRRLAISSDLFRYRAGLAALELAGLAAQEGQPVRGLFARLELVLDELAEARIDARLALSAFELGFLVELGLAPALARCAACGRVAPPAASPRASSVFSPGAGGRLCRRCAEEARASGRRVFALSTRTLELAAVLANDGPEALAGRISDAELEKVRAFVVRFLEYHLESRPKSYRRTVGGVAGAPGLATP